MDTAHYKFEETYIPIAEGLSLRKLCYHTNFVDQSAKMRLLEK
jgi:hypothetical protein